VLYLLDANILITAANTYYGLDRVPEFWEWLVHQGDSGNLKVPVEMYEEVLEGHEDDLLEWAKNDNVRAALEFAESSNPEVVQQVVKVGYADDLTDVEVEKIGRDPFLISYGFVDPNRCIATTEISKPSRTRHNRQIPDVCAALSVSWCGPWDLNKSLGFKTGWKT
jgi:hypothetical protein